MKRCRSVRRPPLLRGLLPCCWTAVSLLAACLGGGCNSRSVEQLLDSFSQAAGTHQPGSAAADDVAAGEADPAAAARFCDSSRSAPRSGSATAGAERLTSSTTKGFSDGLAKRGTSSDQLRQQCRDELQRHHDYAFDFDLTSLDGRRLRLSQFTGRVLIIDVWATWCPPCRREIPHFVELHHRYGDDGLAIVGINYERASTDSQARQKIEAFMQRQAIPYPLALGTESLKDQIPGFRGYPTTLMIDRSGRVRATLVGARSLEYLETMASLLMDEPYDRLPGASATDGPPSLPAPPRIQLNPFAVDHAPPA